MLIPVSLLTIILSILLIYYNWSKNRNVIYLGVSLITLACFGLAHEVLMNSGNPVLLAIIFNHITPAYLIPGPMIFFYVRGNLRDDHRLKTADYFHFIPAFIQLIGVLPWFIKPWAEKLDIAHILISDISQYRVLSFNQFIPTQVSLLLRPIHLLAYVLLSMTQLWKFRPYSLKGVQIPQHLFLINYRWMLILLTSLLLMCTSYFLFAYQAAYADAESILKKTALLQQMAGLFFFSSSALLLFFPEVLYGMPRVKKDVFAVRINEIKKKDTEPKSEEAEDEFIEIKNNILTYLDVQKPYTRFDFSVNEMAQYLDVPLNQLSYCLNRVMNTKFTELRMEYRVNYARELLSSGKSKELTIEAIGNMSGFSSRSSFYAAFKEKVGMSPTEYLEKMDAELLANQ